MTTVITKTMADKNDLGEWLHSLDQLTGHWRDVQWQIADLLREGIDRMSNRYAVTELYRLASETMGVSVKTLQNLVSVARRFPPADRVGELAPSFHMVVAGLEPESAREMLDRAAEENWSRGRLATAVTGQRTVVDVETGELIPVPIPGLPTGGNDEDLDFEEARRVTFVVTLDASGIEAFASAFCRVTDTTNALMLAQLLIANVNREIGRTVVALVDARTNQTL